MPMASNRIGMASNRLDQRLLDIGSTLAHPFDEDLTTHRIPFFPSPLIGVPYSF